MYTVNRSFFSVVAAFLIAVSAPSTLSAQSIWIDPGMEKALTVEMLKPNFEGGGATFTTSVHFVGLQLPASSRLRVVAEVPFAYADVKDEADPLPEGADKATFGNPYLGIEWRATPESPFFIEAGARAPLTPDIFTDETIEGGSFAAAIGLLTEFGNRSEAFVPALVPVNAYANYMLRMNESPVALRLRGGPSVWIPTTGADVELLASYSAQLWYMANRWSLGGGYIGRAIVTAEETSFGEATLNQVGGSANLSLGRFVPGLQFRVPLDEDDGVDFIAGLNLGVRLN